MMRGGLAIDDVLGQSAREARKAWLTEGRGGASRSGEISVVPTDSTANTKDCLIAHLAYMTRCLLGKSARLAELHRVRRNTTHQESKTNGRYIQLVVHRRFICLQRHRTSDDCQTQTSTMQQ
eukprot:scaffold53257_cov39-Prasinocladus_malaysianus.AAC.2